MLCARCLRTTLSRRQTPLALRPIGRLLYSTESPAAAAAAPKLSTPTTSPGDEAQSKASPAAARSICVEGTVLNGLNYTKGGQDPVALKDEEYPEWLWSCLDVVKKSADAADDGVGDEFSKSKKERKLAAKRQRALEAKLLAEGNLAALAPKVPLQQQSVDLPGRDGAGLADNIEAADKRLELKKAMRKERKAKIKESNYLRSM